MLDPGAPNPLAAIIELEGETAHAEGQPRHANPQSDPKYVDAWYLGWENAERDRAGRPAEPDRKSAGGNQSG